MKSIKYLRLVPLDPFGKKNFISSYTLLLLSFVISATSLAGARDFGFERSNPEYKELINAISPRIQDAIADEDYFLAAMLSEKFLSDYKAAIKYMKTYMDKKSPYGLGGHVFMAARSLARNYARTGNFLEAEKWLQKTREIIASLYWYNKTKNEIERCRQWLPILEQRIKTYRKAPSATKYRDIIRVYMELDEYGHALASINQTRKEYPNAPWFKTKEFIYFHDFLTSYITAEKPQGERALSKLIEKSNPQVAALFQELHKIEADKSEFCRKKWKSMSTIEKAKFANRYSRQVPSKGLDWEPAEAEAEEFLRQQKLSYQPWWHQQKHWEDRMAALVGDYLTKEESAPFEKRESEVIDKIVAIGEGAIPDLIATLWNAYWKSPGGREANWSAMAFSKMGEIAVPALGAELESTLKPSETGRVPYRKLVYILRALAGIKDPSTIPLLRKALQLNYPEHCSIVLEALDRFDGALTEDLLLPLWQHENSGVRHCVAIYLGKYGSERTIEILERDLPTAYAEAAYEIKNAIWNIKKRFGQSPGPKPEPPRWEKSDPSPKWAGIEKSLKSPNPGIRITALQQLGRQAENSAEIKPLLAIAETDTSPEIRTAAMEAARRAFSRLKKQPCDDKEIASALQSMFHELIRIAMCGDESLKAKMLQGAHSYQDYESDNYFQLLCHLIIDGMQSEHQELHAESFLAFVEIFRDRDDLINKYVTKKVRQIIEKIALDSLDSKYGRVKVDAISAVEILRLKAAREKLVQIALNDESYHRDHALRVLEVVGDSSCIPALAKIAKSDIHVDMWGLHDNREQAWQTIKALSGKR